MGFSGTSQVETYKLSKNGLFVVKIAHRSCPAWLDHGRNDFVLHGLRRTCRPAPLRDGNPLHAHFRLRTQKIDMQQAIIKPGSTNLNALRQYERLVKLPRGNPTMKEHPPLTVIGLATADHELVVFLRNLKIVHHEPCHSQRNPQGCLAQLFDVVGRITVGRGFGRTLKHLLKMIETKKHG